MKINNQLLKYIEGHLNSSDSEEFEKLLDTDNELNLQYEILSDLVNNAKLEEVPYKIKAKSYKILDIKDLSFMDIIIERASDIFNVLKGQDHLLEINPSFITRGSDESLLFSKQMNKYNIFCDIFLDEDKILVNFGASNDKNKKINNIKFVIINDSNEYIEKFTNESGNTGSFNIKQDIYSIKVLNNDINIGNIQINIS
tara:strand:- start:121 stop:717 length:597 start_codon:yes stop_codon:yes gene_type:complete